MNRGQGAMEYLMTYGWAILIVVIVGIMLWQSGVFGVGAEGSSGFEKVRVYDFVWADDFAVSYTNTAGDSLKNVQITYSGDLSGLSTTWDGSESWSTGHEYTDTVSQNCPGGGYAIDVSITYTAESGLAHIDHGTIRGKCNAVAASIGTLISGSDWIELPSNPVIDPIWRAYYPSTIFDSNNFSGDGNSTPYKVWYSDGSGNTYQAESIDGKNFTTTATLIGLSSPHHVHVVHTDFPNGAKYKIWYWNTSASIYTNESLCTADSLDGYNFTNNTAINGNLLNSSGGAWNRGTYGPIDVFYNSTASNSGPNPFDYTYAMYFDATTGALEAWGLGYSTDGVNWTIYGGSPVLDVGNPGAWTAPGTGEWDSNYATFGTVVRDGSDWNMWYSGGQAGANEAIGFATSPDGLNWTKFPDNPVITRQAGTWKEVRVYTPSVWVDSLGFHGYGDSVDHKMWMSGRSSSGNYAIGYAYGWSSSSFTKRSDPLSPATLTIKATTEVHSDTSLTVYGKDATGSSLTGTANFSAGPAGRTVMVSAALPFKTVSLMTASNGTKGDTFVLKEA